jgi:hypothetical protein
MCSDLFFYPSQFCGVSFFPLAVGSPMCTPHERPMWKKKKVPTCSAVLSRVASRGFHVTSALEASMSKKKKDGILFLYHDVHTSPSLSDKFATAFSFSLSSSLRRYLLSILRREFIGVTLTGCDTCFTQVRSFFYFLSIMTKRFLHQDISIRHKSSVIEFDTRRRQVGGEFAFSVHSVVDLI